MGHPESVELQDPSVSGWRGRRREKGVVRWSPPAQLGRLRIQAPEGLRAAVVPLKPGLYLVAEVDNTQTAVSGAEVGAVAMVTAITQAARGALKLKQKADEEGVTVRELVQDRARKGAAVLRKGRDLLDRRRGDEPELLEADRPQPIPPWSSVAGSAQLVRWGGWQ